MSEILSTSIRMDKKQRAQILISGVVQGVGFRPFVYKLATSLGLTGYVLNNERGVEMEVEGSETKINEFLIRLRTEKPVRSIISNFTITEIPLVGDCEFVIQPSVANGRKQVSIHPDIAVCHDCLNEIFNPSNRRYLYPFTNCTNCGPRFSIIESVPYDRENTSMREFCMCEQCKKEYNNPFDRRYHAQPIACPECGPWIELWSKKGEVIASRHEAILLIVQAIFDGQIVAVKGLGGFQLIVLAENDDAVKRLRRLKNREEKPFALMFPKIEDVCLVCEVGQIERQTIDSPESPIVLLRRKDSSNSRFTISEQVAPGNPYLGVMLPYTPLHHILMRLINKPIVATSGNISDEPICVDNKEAIHRLSNITDLFLVHNRRIVRHVDDSVVSIVAGSASVMRRARGYAPLPIEMHRNLKPVLALGAHLKNAVSFAFENKTFTSQYIGDLETLEAFSCFKKSANDLPVLYERKPEMVVCDLHPDYLSSKYAEETGLPVLKVQHHYAHVLSCMAENNIKPPVLGVAWDGTGLGTDGTIWGGEFLLIKKDGFERVAYFKPFRLPGGDFAVRECRRSALGVLFEIFGEEIVNFKNLPVINSFKNEELKNLINLLKSEKGCLRTSSVGRLFDAVSSILGIRQISRYEGQGAIELEFCVANCKTDEEYPINIVETGSQNSVGYNGVQKNNEKNFILMLDWRQTLKSIIEDYINGICISSISAKFHNTMVKFIIETAQKVGQRKVALSGGCFQNRYLTERAINKLNENGFAVYNHKLIPCNDGGIALGQVMAAAITEII